MNPAINTELSDPPRSLHINHRGTEMKINSLALVLSRHFVARMYPGGTQAFLGDQVTEHGATRGLQVDDDLLAVSDADPKALTATSVQLRALAAETVDDGAPCVLVDPLKGPVVACRWLTCSNEGDGTVSLIYTGIQTPTTPSLFKLSDDNGLVTWLDLETGRQLTSESTSHASAGRIASAIGSRTALLDAAAQAVASREWEGERDDAAGTIRFVLIAGPLLELNLTCRVLDSADSIMLLVRLPGRVRAERISAVAEYLAGANWGMDIGAFDIDLSDGEVLFRASIVAPDGLVSPKAVELAVDRSMGAVTHYASGLIDVSGGAEPRDVLARVEET